MNYIINKKFASTHRAHTTHTHIHKPSYIIYSVRNGDHNKILKMQMKELKMLQQKQGERRDDDEVCIFYLYKIYDKRDITVEMVSVGFAYFFFSLIRTIFIYFFGIRLKRRWPLVCFFFFYSLQCLLVYSLHTHNLL